MVGIENEIIALSLSARKMGTLHYRHYHFEVLRLVCVFAEHPAVTWSVAEQITGRGLPRPVCLLLEDHTCPCRDLETQAPIGN